MEIRNLLRFAFATLACANVAVAQPYPATDSDGDGIADARDNCLSIANPDQRDTNADGFGNLCDLDLNDDGSVNLADLSLFRSAYFSSDPDADANGDGIVNALDLFILRNLFFQPPGPTRFVAWAAGTDGAWGDPQNWRPARVPQTDDHVLIEASGAPIVSLSTPGTASVASLELGGSLDLAAPASLAIQFGVRVPFPATLALHGADLSVGGIDIDGGTLTLEGVDLSLPPIAGNGEVRFLQGETSTLTDARFDGVDIVVEALSHAAFAGSLDIEGGYVEVETTLPAQQRAGQTTQLDWRALTALDVSGFVQFRVNEGDAPAAATQLRILPDSGLQPPPGFELSVYGAATLSANPAAPAPANYGLYTTVEFDGELVVEADALRFDNFLQCRFGKLAFAEAVTAVEFAPGSSVLIDACDIQTPDGLLQNGSLNIYNSSGTLGGLVGDGTTQIIGSQLRLVGQHTAGYLNDGFSDDFNYFQLAGSVWSGPDFSDTELVLRADRWFFEPGSRLLNLEITAIDAVVGAAQSVVLQDIRLTNGSLSLAPGAQVDFDGETQLFGTVRLLAPDTIQSVPPVLRFTGPDGSLLGFGTIVVEPAVIPGAAVTDIVVDTTGAPFIIEQFVSLESWHSAVIRSDSAAGLINEGAIGVDGSNAVPGETVQLEITGPFENQGTISALNGAQLVLDGTWINFGLIDVQDAALQLSGDWENPGQIDVTDGSVALTLRPGEDSIGSIALDDATLLLDGVYFLNPLAEVTTAGDSEIRFNGIIDSSTQFLDLDTLPANFILDAAGLLQDLYIQGSVPLLAQGGTLDNVDLETDLIVSDGATLTVVNEVVLFDAAIELAAEQQLTTLSLPDGGSPGNAIGGHGEIRFAGTAVTDDLNVIEVGQNSGIVGPVLRTTTSGGQIVSVPEAPMTLFADISLEAPGRELLLEASDEPVTIDGDILLGAGTTLRSSDDLTLGFSSPTSHTLTIEFVGLDNFGRILSTAPGAPVLETNQAALIVNMVDGFIPSECDRFRIVDNYHAIEPFGSVSGTGLGGFSIDLSYDFSFVEMTLFQQPCP